MRSQDSTGSKVQGASPAHKAAYRLFPSVAPTPPASPVCLQKAALLRVGSQRPRSSSLDDNGRSTVGIHQVRPSQLAVRRGCKNSISDLKPMSTVQELPLDSPILPARFTPRPPTAELPERHNRSSSAPGESLMTEHQGQGVQLNSLWSSTQAVSSTQTLIGLGLTLPAEQEDARPRSKRGPKRKLSLRLNLRTPEESPPPPPPPKSPRYHSRDSSVASTVSVASTAHSRSSSIQSRTSVRGDSPVAVAQSIISVKPTFVHHSHLSYQASVRTPPTVDEARESYFGETSNPLGSHPPSLPAKEPSRAKLAIIRKPAPLLPSKSAEEMSPRRYRHDPAI